MRPLLVISTALLLACSTSKNPNASAGDTSHVDSGQIDIDGGSVCIDQAAVIAALGGAESCNTLPGQSIQLGADAGSCDQRVIHACTAQCVGSALDSQMQDLVRLCGGLPLESRLGIIFDHGCAVQMVADITGPNPAALTDCLARHLEVTHYACADEIPCWTTEYSLIAAN